MRETDPIKAMLSEIDALLARRAPADAPAAAVPAAPPSPILPPIAPEPEAPVAAVAAPAPEPGSEFAPRQRTIVLVDDNNDYRGLIKALLESGSYKVLEAPNGILALPLIMKSDPDLVIADFNMPKMNGYELIEELRARPETRRTPVIMFTGAPNRRHLKSMDMGIAAFLEKPVPNKALLAAVAKALRLPPPPPRAAPAAAPALRIERVASTFEAPAVLPPAPEPVRAPGPLPAPIPAPAPVPAPPAATAPELAEDAVIVEKPQDGEPSLQEIPPEGTGAIDELLEEEAALEVLESDEKAAAAQEEVGLEKLANDSPLIARVNRILLQAVEAKASDIHIEPQETHVTVRLRVDGALKKLCTLPIALHPRLSARLKIMANMVITERRLPQDGQFRVQVKGKKIEFRVSSLPCTYGEKLVLRVLGQSKLQADLQSLALTERERSAVGAALKSPHGLVLVTGPTGSGKTTTLYTMINVLNRPDVNIMTAEDPVEYEVADISQVKVRPAIGLTFESVLRAFLRQDPDIMLIGEIRDRETAEIAVKASITGHLVFSTLHTNSAPATVVRLTHMGVAPYLVAASVKLVIAQRLIRLLCPSCKAPQPLTEEDRRFLTPEEAAALTQACRPVGCEACRQTGYAGRRPVFEVMPLASPELRQLVCDGAPADALTRQAVKEGMTPLRRSALEAVARSQASLEDAFKIVLGD